MNWELEGASVSSFDAQSYTNTMSSNRNQQRSVFGSNPFLGLANNNGTFLGFGTGKSVVGLNAAKVPDMIAAIEQYCAEIDTYLKGLTPEAESGVAFKGEGVHDALKAYMEDVKAYCTNLISQLKAFCDKLQDVNDQWKAAVERMGENIKSTSGDSFAKGEQYTRTSQPSS